MNKEQKKELDGLVIHSECCIAQNYNIDEKEKDCYCEVKKIEDFINKLLKEERERILKELPK